MRSCCPFARQLTLSSMIQAHINTVFQKKNPYEAFIKMNIFQVIGYYNDWEFYTYSKRQAKKMFRQMFPGDKIYLVTKVALPF